jgi:pimeloyl-ACP methyl ester carboxylesterase
MLVSVGDVRLFVDVDGAKLVPDGKSMRERPTIVMVHGGPGADHTTTRSGTRRVPRSLRSSNTTIAGMAAAKTVRGSAGI